MGGAQHQCECGWVVCGVCIGRSGQFVSYNNEQKGSVDARQLAEANYWFWICELMQSRLARCLDCLATNRAALSNDIAPVPHLRPAIRTHARG